MRNIGTMEKQWAVKVEGQIRQYDTEAETGAVYQAAMARHEAGFTPDPPQLLFRILPAWTVVT